MQELAQQEGFSIPIYKTTKSGELHLPTFYSNVEVEGEIFRGKEGKSKKQAELNAAKVAYSILKERKSLVPVCDGIYAIGFNVRHKEVLLVILHEEQLELIKYVLFGASILILIYSLFRYYVWNISHSD